MNLRETRYRYLDRFVGAAVLLVFLELVAHLLIRMSDVTAVGDFLISYQKWIYLVPFVLYVSVVYLLFLISTIIKVAFMFREILRSSRPSRR